MKTEWIRGRFRGVYSAPRRKGADGARRVPLDLQDGELFDVVAIAPPEEKEGLHFDRVRVKFAPGNGFAEGERPVFDVRIRDCQLLYPAESVHHLYGTLVGELSARLLPEPVEAPLELLRSAEPLRQSEELDAGEPAAAPQSDAPPLAPLRLQLPEPPGEHHQDTSHDQNMERLLWLLVPTLLFAVGTALAAGFGPETAAIWLAPLAGAIAIRQTPERFRIHGTLAGRWFGGVCALAPIFAILTPITIGSIRDGCPAWIHADLLLLGAPVVAAALVRTQGWVWTCALIWTAALVSWSVRHTGV